MIRTFGTFLLLLTSVVLFAQKDTVFVKDMTSSWQTFDGSGLFVPYIQQQSEIIFFEVPRQSGALIKVQCKVSFDVWVNDQIYLSQFKGTTFLNLDSLNNSHLELPTLTFYSSDWREGDLITELYEVIKTGREKAYGKITKQGHLDQNSYLIVLAILILMVGAYRRFFPGTFSKSYSNPLSFKLRGLSAEDNYQNFLGFDNIVAIFYLSIMASLLSYYLGYQMIQLGISPSWQVSVPVIILVALIGGVMLIGKYLWSLMVSAIFQFKDFPNIQNQDYIHFLILLTSVCLGLSIIDYTQYNFTSEFLRSSIIMIYVIMLIFFQFWMAIKLDKLYSHRKLMIISYLCTTEFLPSFVIIIWLLKS